MNIKLLALFGVVVLVYFGVMELLTPRFGRFQARLILFGALVAIYLVAMAIKWWSSKKVDPDQ
jgi:hypothetical protein